MPGINNSRWANKPVSGTSTIVPSTASSGQPGETDRHVSISSFGYQAPNATASKQPPPCSTAKPPNDLSNQAGPARPILKAFERAEVAGRAAAKRMKELQGDATNPTMPFLYPNYGYPSPTPNATARPAVARSVTMLTASPSRPAAEATAQRRVRLHKLFNTWVPRASEFYDVCGTLGLTAEEVKAIQDEIVRYRIESTRAAGKHTSYTAEWEIAPAHLPLQRRARGSTTGEEEDDPLGLGLPKAIREGTHAGEARNLLE